MAQKNKQMSPIKVVALSLLLTQCYGSGEQSVCSTPETKQPNLTTSQFAEVSHIGGQALRCGYRQGFVRTYFVPDTCPPGGTTPEQCLQGSVGYASYIIGPLSGEVLRAYIYLNKDILANYTPKLQQFWFWHECAHIQAKDLLSTITRTSETRADFTGLRDLQNNCGLTRTELENFAPAIYALKEQGPYFSGAKRHQLLLACFDKLQAGENCDALLP